jgi:hypothetical protein
MDNIAGPPVEGENFFGRDAEVVSLWETLQDHDVLLRGSRRIGKTSVARAVMKVAAVNGWRVIEVNIASCVDEQAFVEKLAKAVEAHGKSWVAQAFAGISEGVAELLRRVQTVRLPVPGAGPLGVELSTASVEDWSDVASDTLRLLSKAQDRWLVYVDELPIFLFNIIANDNAAGVQRVRRFLDWFRNDVRAMPECRQVRWLVTGSVGLDTLVQRHRMAATINSLKHESLEPYTESVALEMVQRLAQRYNVHFNAGEALVFVRAVQWSQPYYLQLVFNFLRQLIQSTGKPPGQLIADAVEKSVQPGPDNDFHHWEERLFTQLGNADGSHAVALLMLAAQDRNGARPEVLLAEIQRRMPDDTADKHRHKFIELRDILQRDAYWWPDETGGHRRYRFRLELLRLWWVRRQKL